MKLCALTHSDPPLFLSWGSLPFSCRVLFFLFSVSTSWFSSHFVCAEFCACFLVPHFYSVLCALPSFSCACVSLREYTVSLSLSLCVLVVSVLFSFVLLPSSASSTKRKNKQKRAEKEKSKNQTHVSRGRSALALLTYKTRNHTITIEEQPQRRQTIVTQVHIPKRLFLPFSFLFHFPITLRKRRERASERAEKEKVALQALG